MIVPRETASLAGTWAPPPLFRGRTAFLLGGGPSLGAVDIGRLRGRAVVAINEAGHRAPWADVLYFQDTTWLDAPRNDALVAGWPGIVVSPSRVPGWASGIRRIAAEPRERLLPGPAMRRGRSSGQGAVALAAVLGAPRIVLLGYDMRLVDGRANFHDAYAQPADAARLAIFRQHFRGWRAAAERDGIRIVNATPGSALDELERVELADELAREDGA